MDKYENFLRGYEKGIEGSSEKRIQSGKSGDFGKKCLQIRLLTVFTLTGIRDFPV